MNKQRLEFATEVFLLEMRRQWSVLHPGEPCPVKSLQEYPAEQRSALMAAVQKSAGAAAPESDKVYEKWAKKRREEAQPEAV